MKKLVWLIVLILILGGAWWWGNQRTPVIPTEKETVKIGIILPLTEASADAGEYVKQGIALAEQEINSNPQLQYHVRLIFEDSQYKGERAASAAQKLINVDGVKYIIGEYGSSQTLAVAPIAEINKVILLSPASQSSTITTAGDFIFRTQVTTKQDADFFARYVFERAGNQKLAIIAIKTDYGTSYINDFTNAYETAGGKVAATEVLDVNQTDFRTPLLRMKTNGIQAIVLAGNRQFNGILLKQMNELSFAPQLFASSVTEGKELLKVAGDAAEGLIYPYPFDEDSIDQIQLSFQNKYIDRYGEKSEMLAANGYDSLMLISRCLEQTGNNTERVRDCLYSTKNYPGASGTLSFDRNGDVTKQFIIKTVRDGQFVRIDE